MRWLLGDELHPGGEATTARALELIAAAPGDRLLDVACGAGTSALLAARQFGCEVTGLDYGEQAVSGARSAAQAAGLDGAIEFVQGDAEDLPFADASFDAVLCECSLCTFPDKPRALSEIHRVLSPGGRLALSDVVADSDLLPSELQGAMATVACVGSALSREGYEAALEDAGFELQATESRADDVASVAERVEDRLRGVRVIGLKAAEDLPIDMDDAIALVRMSRSAISDGILGYTVFAAVRP